METRRQRERLPEDFDGVDLRTPGVRMVPLIALEPLRTKTVFGSGKVERAMDGYRVGAAIPPISVCDGRLDDGNHRLTAARRVGLGQIAVEFHVSSIPRTPTEIRVMPLVADLPVSSLAHIIAQPMGPGLELTDPYVSALAEAFRLAEAGTGQWPPPIIAFRREDGQLGYWDGMHRLVAARLASVRTIRALIFDGLREAADAAREREHLRAQVGARAVPVASLSTHRVPAEFTMDDPYIAGLVLAYRGETTPAPPIRIIRYGERRGLVLVDGNHRLAAARLAGVFAISAQIEDASKVRIPRRIERFSSPLQRQGAPAPLPGSVDRPKATRLRFRGGCPT